MASSRFAKASTANKQLRVGTDYGDDDSATSCERDTSPVRHRALHPLQRDDRKLSAHGRGVSSMRTTASKRQSSLELAQAVSRPQVIGPQTPFWPSGRGNIKPNRSFSHLPTQLSVVTRGAPRVLTLQAAGGEGSSEPVVGRTTASSSSRPARTCVQRVSVRGAGQGQAAGRRRHSVPRPVHPPHRQQRGAGAVE